MRIIILILIMNIAGFVKGQSLEEFKKLAASNNPGLQASYEEFRASMARVRQVASLPDPRLSFGYFIVPVETRVGPQQARISLSQAFPWFGTLAVKKDRAALLAEAKFMAFEEKKYALFYEVEKVFYELFLLEKKLEITREDLRILESLEKIALQKYESAQTGMVDVIRIQTLIRESKFRINSIQDKRKPLIYSFNTLLNRELNTEIILPDTIETKTLPAWDLQDSMVNGNPFLQKLDLEKSGWEMSSRVANKEGLPNFSIGLDYIVTGNRSDGMIQDNGKDALMPTVSMSIPIFRKKYKGMNEEAEALTRAWDFYREEKVNNLETELEQALFQYTNSLDRRSLIIEQLKATEQAVRLLTTTYSSASSEFEEVLRARQLILDYELELIESEMKINTSLSKIYYLTGKINTNENNN